MKSTHAVCPLNRKTNSDDLNLSESCSRAPSAGGLDGSGHLGAKGGAHHQAIRLSPINPRPETWQGLAQREVLGSCNNGRPSWRVAPYNTICISPQSKGLGVSGYDLRRQ